MQLTPYRRVLALPGVRSLIFVALVARVPITAAGVTLTLHVVLGLHRGYGAAGLVGAAATAGMAIGAPVLGRLVDRRGLRPVLVITILGTALFWAAAPLLPYPVLLGAALIGGMVSVPIFSVVRQSLAALVPEEHRKPAYSIDSISVEIAYAIGPALAVLAVTAVSSRIGAWLVGAAMVLGGSALWLLNPPTRAEHEPEVGQGTVRRRSWLRPALIAVLAACAAATLVLSGTEVAAVALLRQAGEVKLAGLIFALWSVYSMTGGFVYGSLRRGPHPLVLTILLGATSTLLALAGNALWVAILLIPAGILCAPSIAASADLVSRLVPAAARGEAMGLYASALTLGIAAGAPLAGAVADAAGASVSFLVVGLVGTGLALIAMASTLRRRSSTPAVERVPVGSGVN